jgi:hypothetical protein
VRLVLQGPSKSPPSAASPIHVTAKSKSRHQLQNIFVDNRGLPDQPDEYDTLFHNIDSGTILRKLQHPPPPLDVVDPAFHFPYEEAIRGDRLWSQLNISNLPPSSWDKVINLGKKYLTVFDGRGVWVSVKNYKCIINTGNTLPMTVKKIHYGPKEIPIMKKAITALLKAGHICQIHDGWWLFKAVLAPKPH